MSEVQRITLQRLKEQIVKYTEAHLDADRHKLRAMSTITQQTLEQYPHAVFVYGDNTLRCGKGRTAKLRDHPRAYGFVTKRGPAPTKEACFTPAEYEPILRHEIHNLTRLIRTHRHRTFLISHLGTGKANAHGILEMIAEKIDELANEPNVILL